jgi:lysozyme family protein
MANTLKELRPEYMDLWRTMEFSANNEARADKVAGRLLSYLDRYMGIQRLTGVPAAFIMVAHERESSGNWNTYLGNGEPLNRVTTLVPKGRGPFKTFEEGAMDALTLEHMTGIELASWDEATLCFWLESFNGFGYRMYHQMPSPYLWSGTNHQKIGKYTGDGHFDPTVMDSQLGGMAVYAAIIKAAPQLDLGGPAGGPVWLGRYTIAPQTSNVPQVPPPKPIEPSVSVTHTSQHPVWDALITFLRVLFDTRSKK